MGMFGPQCITVPTDASQHPSASMLYMLELLYGTLLSNQTVCMALCWVMKSSGTASRTQTLLLMHLRRCRLVPEVAGVQQRRQCIAL